MNEPNGEIKIDKGIPIPDKCTGRKTQANLFRSMEIGDSVLLAGLDSRDAHPRFQRYAKQTGYKFTCRKVEGGVRVWRVS